MSNDINKMDFKQLRNEVQLLRDELAIMKRKYEDILYNLDNENFSSRFIKEKDGMKTSIEQTEKSITLQAEKVEENSSSIGNLEVTADAISANVSSVFNEIEEISSKDELRTKPTNKIYSLNGENYHYNSIMNEWEKIVGNSVASSFVQVDDGFYLKGDVKLNGNLISNGRIEGYNAAGEKDGLFVKSGNNEWVFSDLSLYSNGKLIFSAYKSGAIQNPKCSIYAPKALTTLVPSHNHGIENGTRLALTNDGATVSGWVEFKQSGSHQHYLSDDDEPVLEV